MGESSPNQSFVDVEVDELQWDYVSREEVLLHLQTYNRLPSSEATLSHLQ
jgi:hypothetical protein